ncbi:peptidylprolyl isomerase [Gemmatimonadota bacterium]
MSAKLKYLSFFCLLAIALGACSKDENLQAQAPTAKIRKVPPKTEPKIKELQPDDEVAVISTDFGRIILRFYPEMAPKHVKNYKSLARAKFYDGTTFHRVIPDFMIQGGDPNSRDANLNNDGAGNGPRTLRSEFNPTPHTRGSLAMARSSDPHSASCQFFICVADSPWLNGQYTNFGKVVKGMDVADKIVKLPRNERDNPGKAATVKSITIERAGDVLDF